MNKIAIIGSGPTAVYTAKYLLEQNLPLSITLFESQAEAGKGTPYHQNWNDKEMLSNIAGIELPPVTESLVSWLQKNSEYDLAAMGIARSDIDERRFFPRVVLGKYFQAQLKKLLHKASRSKAEMIVKTRHKVLDVTVTEGGIKLVVQQNGNEIHHFVYDYVVMATGHVWPNETEIWPGYFLSPWPAIALRTIGHCQVGIRGTSLSAIDAVVALSVARGMFARNSEGRLDYYAEPGTEAFHVTIMSRKGLLPEADFYCPIPYEPLCMFTRQAINGIIASCPQAHLLDTVFSLFKAELKQCDPAYAQAIGLEQLTLEAFANAYFKERLQSSPFRWAERNLSEAKENLAQKFTVPWRYAILRMHEVITHIVPKLSARDHRRFNAHIKHIFVDDYATVPHESIERLLALHRAGKLDILRLGDEYQIDSESPEKGAILTLHHQKIHFPAFIEAIGQRTLSVHEFPFPGLWKQGIVTTATAPHFTYTSLGQRVIEPVDIGGIALDASYHPVSGIGLASRLYCLSLPFMLSQFPFSQGITSSHEMGRDVAGDIGKAYH